MQYKDFWSRSRYAYKPSYDIIIRTINGCPQLVRIGDRIGSEYRAR